MMKISFYSIVVILIFLMIEKASALELKNVTLMTDIVAIKNVDVKS